MTNEVIRTWLEIYTKINQSSINIFLCGKKTSDLNSIRHFLLKKYNEIPRANIVLPEWLFHDLLDKPEYDLLSLEGILAEDVDKIIIPIESFGAACELGAFSVIRETCDKLLVISDVHYKNDQSFLRYGPFKLVKKSKGHLIFFKPNDMESMAKNVIDKTIYARYEKDRDLSKFSIFDIATLIGILLYVLRPIKKSELKNIVENITKEKERIDAAIEILVQREYLFVTKVARHDSSIDYSEKGIEYYNNILKINGKERLANRLRAKSLWTMRKDQTIFRGDLERARFLDKTSE